MTQADLFLARPEQPLVSVFVDAIMPCLRNPRWPFDKSCHLYILPGELEPLHLFARRLQLRRSWFQHSPGRMPHYDLTEGKRFAALRLGALSSDRYHLVSALRAWRAHPIPNHEH